MPDEQTDAKVQAWLEQFSAAIRDEVPGDVHVSPGDLMLLVNFAWIGAYATMGSAADVPEMKKGLLAAARSHVEALSAFLDQGRGKQEAAAVHASAVMIEMIRGRYSEFCLGPDEVDE